MHYGLEPPSGKHTPAFVRMSRYTRATCRPACCGRYRSGCARRILDSVFPMRGSPPLLACGWWSCQFPQRELGLVLPVLGAFFSLLHRANSYQRKGVLELPAHSRSLGGRRVRVDEVVG